MVYNINGSKCKAYHVLAACTHLALLQVCDRYLLWLKYPVKYKYVRGYTKCFKANSDQQLTLIKSLTVVCTRVPFEQARKARFYNSLVEETSRSLIQLSFISNYSVDINLLLKVKNCSIKAGNSVKQYSSYNFQMYMTICTEYHQYIFHEVYHFCYLDDGHLAE